MTRFLLSFVILMVFACPLTAQDQPSQTEAEKRAEERRKRNEESKKRAEESRIKFEERVKQMEEESRKFREEADRRYQEAVKKNEENSRIRREKDNQESESMFKVFGIRSDDIGDRRVSKLRTPKGVNVLHEGGLTFTLLVNDVDFLAKKGENVGKKFAYNSTLSNAQYSLEQQRREFCPAGFEYARQYYKWDNAERKTLVCSYEAYLSLQAAEKRNYSFLACLYNLWYPQELEKGTATVAQTPHHGLTLRFAEGMKTDAKFFCDLESRKNEDVEELKPGEKTTRCRWMAYSADIEGKPVTVALCCWPEFKMYAYTREPSEGKFAVLSAGWKKQTPPKSKVVGPGDSLNEMAHYYYCVMLWDGKMAPGAIERAYTQWTNDEKTYLRPIRLADGNSGRTPTGFPRSNVSAPPTIRPNINIK